jgi:hypothetical protein
MNEWATALFKSSSPLSSPSTHKPLGTKPTETTSEPLHMLFPLLEILFPLPAQLTPICPSDLVLTTIFSEGSASSAPGKLFLEPFFWGGRLGFELQGLTLAKQALYCLSHTFSPFGSGYFGDGGVSQNI